MPLKNLRDADVEQTRRSGTRPMMPAVKEDDLHPAFTDEEENTSPGNTNVVVYQHFLRVFDELSPRDRELLLSIAESFLMMKQEERTILVNAAERMSGLVR